jgi:bile acid:Na+ symporter, BASS family
VADILDVIFKVSILLFMIGNMAGIGTELALREALKALRDIRFIVMTLVCGWVLGPCFAYLLVRIVPLDHSYATGLILLSLTPCAPFIPMMVRKANGDVGHTCAIVLVTAIGTVAFMPFAVPLMITGLTADAWAIGRPLVFVVLVPLLAGMALRSFAEPVAFRMYPLIKKTTDVITLVMLAVVAITYGKAVIEAIGSFAIGTLVVFVGAVTLATDRLGFSLPHTERSVLTIGMSTRNLGAAIIPLMSLEVDPRSIVMVVLGIPVTLISSFLAARWYARHILKGEAVQIPSTRLG